MHLLIITKQYLSYVNVLQRGGWMPAITVVLFLTKICLWVCYPVQGLNLWPGVLEPERYPLSGGGPYCSEVTVRLLCWVM